jgi:uncharacterized membrane protein
MRLKNLDLIVMVIIAVLNIVWALLPNRPTLIGTILGVPLVFLLPGYTLTEAMFHKRSLAASHRLVISIGLSLAIDIIGGFMLNVLPIGLQALSWAGLLGLLTIVVAVLATYLRRGKQVNRTQPVRLRFTAYQIALFGLATMIAILAVLNDTISAAQQSHPGFTQFWMLPTAQANNSCAVQLGVRNFEATSMTYRVTLTMNGTQRTPEQSIDLAPQQEWQQLVPIAPVPSGKVYIHAQLYRLDKPESVYREVHVTLPNLAISKDGKTRQCGIVHSGRVRWKFQ